MLRHVRGRAEARPSVSRAGGGSLSRHRVSFLEHAALSTPKELGRESACPCKRRSQIWHRFLENAEKILCCLLASLQHLVVA